MDAQRRIVVLQNIAYYANLLLIEAGITPNPPNYEHAKDQQRARSESALKDNTIELFGFHPLPEQIVTPNCLDKAARASFTNLAEEVNGLVKRVDAISRLYEGSHNRIAKIEDAIHMSSKTIQRDFR